VLQAGGFHIDPLRPVERALITHGHSDHARAGHGMVLATQETIDIMRLRYVDGFAGRTQAVAYGERIRLGDVDVAFHPAGHVLGSAQIAVTHGATRIVASGDYKDAPDPTCAPFVLVPCDVSSRKATFGCRCSGMAMRAEVDKLLTRCVVFRARAYRRRLFVGKAQTVIALIRARRSTTRRLLHGAMEAMRLLREPRHRPGEVRRARGVAKADLAGTITLAPPSAITDIWTRRFPDPVAAFASGWMRVRARARQKGIELPLVISDHADWDGLTATIAATGAGEVWVTHGR